MSKKRANSHAIISVIFLISIEYQIQSLNIDIANMKKCVRKTNKRAFVPHLNTSTCLLTLILLDIFIFSVFIEIENFHPSSKKSMLERERTMSVLFMMAEKIDGN